MKPFKSITILVAIVACIVIFWLMPGLNKASDKSYTRLYEDTDGRIGTTKDTTRTKRTTQKKESFPSVPVNPSKKVYKRESISTSSKIAQIKPSMFSRAIHFKQEVVIEKIDSLNQIQVAAIDSVTHVQ